MLEFYDFLTYSFFAIQTGHTFFPTGSEYGNLMLSLAAIIGLVAMSLMPRDCAGEAAAERSLTVGLLAGR